RLFATPSRSLLRRLIVRSSKCVTERRCVARPAAIEAVAAPPANVQITTRPLPEETIGSGLASIKGKRRRISEKLAWARSKSREAGSAPATMRSIILAIVSDIARLEPSQRERPPPSIGTTETTLRRQSTSVIFQLLPPNDRTVGSRSPLRTRLAG